MGRLTIGGLHKFYGATHAVRGVDLDIPEGEFAVLVGPSRFGAADAFGDQADFWRHPAAVEGQARPLAGSGLSGCRASGGG